MKQGIPSRRTRGRGNNNRGRQQQNVRNQQMESNGPAGRLRGTAQQILDRYSALARDASSSGDMVLAENLWQHAEHYARLLNLSAPPQQQGAQQGQRYGNGRDDGIDFSDQQDEDAIAAETFDSQEPLRRQPAPVQEAPAQPAPEADDQPTPPPVWTPADAQAASEEVQPQPEPEQRAAPPRRRRRTRFQRQQEADAASNGDAASAEAAAAPAAPEAEQPKQPLTLPEDRSPAALVELLTQAENAGNASGD
jgi:hypothetical protein